MALVPIAVAPLGVLTLDAPEPQVLIHVPADAHGLHWHHTVLLKRLTTGVWIGLTPMLELFRYDLNVTNHVVLERCAPFPAAQRAMVLAHDAISRASLEGYKRRAATTAVVLGEEDVGEVQSFAWRIADSGHERFSEAVDPAIMADGAAAAFFTAKGVVILDGEETFVEKVFSDDFDGWKAKRSSSMDKRLLGKYISGKKEERPKPEPFSTLMERVHEDASLELPQEGEKATAEYLTAIGGGPGNLVSYHAEWIRLSGVHEASNTAHVHRTVLETIRLFLHHDGINIANTAGGEQLTRWEITTEIATERNPKHPDYSGLDLVAGTAITQDGRARLPRYQKWVTETMKTRSQVWRQDRLYRAEKKGKGAGKFDYNETDDEDGEDHGKGGKRRQRRKKNKSGQGAKDGAGAAEDK